MMAPSFGPFLLCPTIRSVIVGPIDYRSHYSLTSAILERASGDVIEEGRLDLAGCQRPLLRQGQSNTR